MDGKKLFDFFELARQENGRFITNTDYVSEFKTIRGLAARGTLESSATWLLEQTLVVGGVVVSVTYADNANFTQVWDDRLIVFPAAGSGGATNFAISPIRILDSTGAIIDSGNPLDVSGSFVQSGLFVSMTVTNLTVTDVATALPTTALVGRNSILIENRGANPMFLDDAATVTATGALQGWEIIATGQFGTDITDAIPLFGICGAGLSTTVKLLEVA